MRNNKTSKSQILFGVRCVLLALVLLAVSGSIIYDYVFGNGIGPVDLGLRGTALVCAVAVLYFEITTYVKLYN